MTTIQLVCHPTWMRDEMAVARVDLRHSFGLEVPYFSYQDIWWMPQGFAVELNKALVEYGEKPIELISPGNDLLPSVPFEFSRREITARTVNDALTAPVAGWWKSAEAKIDTFPSKFRSALELVEDIENSNLPLNSVLHHTSTVLPIAREYRCFVSNGEVRSTSVYLVTNGAEQTTVYDGAVAVDGDIELVENFVYRLISDVDIPPSVVVDIAVLENDTVALLEFNPSWCSAWYDNDINAVVQCIYDGFNISTADLERWRYTPDAYFAHKLAKKALLPRR